jgi:hypothetical protein
MSFGPEHTRPGSSEDIHWMVSLPEGLVTLVARQGPVFVGHQLGSAQSTKYLENRCFDGVAGPHACRGMPVDLRDVESHATIVTRIHFCARDNVLEITPIFLPVDLVARKLRIKTGIYRTFLEVGDSD